MNTVRLNRCFTVFLNVIAALLLKAQTFEGFLGELTATPLNDRQAKVDVFLAGVPSFPLTEDTLAHFIYSGIGGNLSVPGDFSAWNPSNAPMIRIPGTNFWYRTEVFEQNARLDYKFACDTDVWILDPRNPRTVPGGFGDNSELRMPAYIPPPEIVYDASIPHGTFEDTLFYSAHLNNSRTVRVYLPPGYHQAAEKYPVVLVHDGLEYISFAKMNHVIDRLLSEGLIQPIIAVFVPPVDRSPEYIDDRQQAFTGFIIRELMPWIDAAYRTIPDPAHRAVMGSSAGGNISLWLGMRHPEVFGNAGAFSSYVENDILTCFSDSPRFDLRIYMNHGTHDHLTAIRQSVIGFVPVLRSKKYDCLFEEYPEGHSYGFWRAHLDDALLFFFPASASPIDRGSVSPRKFNP
jgi:enterochelin esterase-like enzyme